MNATMSLTETGDEKNPVRLPPHQRQAERALLGSMLRYNDCIDEVSLLLTAESFYLPAHQTIFRAIVALHQRGGQPVDLVILAEELQRLGEWENAGRGAYLAGLWDDSPTGANAMYYARTVRDKSILRRLMEAGNAIAFQAEQQQQPELLLAEAEQKILAISQSGVDAQTRALRDEVEASVHYLDQRLKGAKTAGVATGFMDLDELTSGLHAGDLILLGARPSVGKTACGLAIANNARKSGIAVFFASLEQSRHELSMRLLCMEASVNSHHVRRGRLSADDACRLADAVVELKSGTFDIDDAPRQSLLRIASNARRLKRKHGLGLIVVDYVQLIEPENRRDPRHEQVGQCSRRLKELAKELAVPVLALAQVGRSAEERTNQRPRLSDLRESGSLEADADTVFLLHRNEEQFPGVIEIIVAKQRNGPTGEVTLAFRKDCMRFADYIAGVPWEEQQPNYASSFSQ